MSCGCTNRKLGGEYERIRRLAKSLAEMDDALVAIYARPDGTFGFDRADIAGDVKIIEYLTPY
ncbi:MAG: hypothetical protein K2G69_08350 [Muribaculaceae bacterium]|nr:hypothetical protein [Muribaculaceae bacterium]